MLYYRGISDLEWNIYELPFPKRYQISTRLLIGESVNVDTIGSQRRTHIQVFAIYICHWRICWDKKDWR